MAVLDIVLPVFGLLAFGYAATFTPVFDAEANRALASFVFWFAIPVLLFRSVAAQPLPDAIPWGYLIAFYGAALLVLAGAALAARRLLGMPALPAAIVGFGAGYGNVVLLGTPLVLAAFGPAGTLPFFLLLAFHSILLMTVGTGLIEIARGRRVGALATARQVVLGIVRNPIPMSLLAGLAFQAAGLALPAAVDRWAALLGAAAGPCALFSVGASLRAYRVAGAIRPALLMVALKMALHPLLVWVATRWLLDVPPLWAAVAVVTAALPCGVNGYLFAQRYAAAEAETAAAVLLATLLSVVTLTLLLAALGAAPSA